MLVVPPFAQPAVKPAILVAMSLLKVPFKAGGAVVSGFVISVLIFSVGVSVGDAFSETFVCALVVSAAITDGAATDGAAESVLGANSVGWSCGSVLGGVVVTISLVTRSPPSAVKSGGSCCTLSSTVPPSTMMITAWSNVEKVIACAFASKPKKLLR